MQTKNKITLLTFLEGMASVNIINYKIKFPNFKTYEEIDNFFYIIKCGQNFSFRKYSIISVVNLFCNQ